MLDLSQHHVMGIINVTPDSFYSGSRVVDAEQACYVAMQMCADGATILDIGGESTRPGAKDVSVDDELERVIPVIKAIREHSDVLISIDTSKADVIQAALSAGANIINDVRALQEPGALEVAALSQAPICLMHMQGKPRSMQQHPSYQDVVADVKSFLADRIDACMHAGIDKSRIIIDPGFGFGKTDQHNFTLIKHLEELQSLQCPILMGVSRKSTIGRVLDVTEEQRLAGSLGLTALALAQGAKIIRTHDVRATADVVKIFQAYQQAP